MKSKVFFTLIASILLIISSTSCSNDPKKNMDLRYNPENIICGTLAYQNSMYCSIEDPLGVDELSSSKKLVRVIDETGRAATPEPNRLLVYIYDDGTKEKKIIIEK